MHRLICGLILCVVAACASAADKRSFDALRVAVEGQRTHIPAELIQAVAEQTRTVIDCSVDETIAANDPRIRPSYSQYIFNATYSWGEIDTGSGRCVVLVQPSTRLLSREEAIDLLTASRIPFPVPDDHGPAVPPPPIIHPVSGCDRMPVVDLDTNTVTTPTCAQ